MRILDYPCNMRLSARKMVIQCLDAWKINNGNKYIYLIITDRNISDRNLDIIVFRIHPRVNMDNIDGCSELMGFNGANEYIYPVFMKRRHGRVYGYDKTVRYNMEYIPTN